MFVQVYNHTDQPQRAAETMTISDTEEQRLRADRARAGRTTTRSAAASCPPKSSCPPPDTTAAFGPTQGVDAALQDQSRLARQPPARDQDHEPRRPRRIGLGRARRLAPGRAVSRALRDGAPPSRLRTVGRREPHARFSERSPCAWRRGRGATGAAVSPPAPSLTSITQTAIRGWTAGAKAVNQASVLLGVAFAALAAFAVVRFRFRSGSCVSCSSVEAVHGRLQFGRARLAGDDHAGDRRGGPGALAHDLGHQVPDGARHRSG